MTRPLLSSLSIAALLIAAGCEKHPDSQTVPGFQEAQARAQAIQDKEAMTPLPINPHPPKFFPPKTER